MDLWDSHCHLQDPRYGGDCEGVIARARSAGVKGMVCCGTREGDWEAVLTLAQLHRELIPCLGLHPWFVAEASPHWLEHLEEAARTHPVGIGECGLDFALEPTDRPLQEGVFRAQVRLAVALDRPLSIHCRKAWESLGRIAREEGLPERGAVIHAFSGSPEIARELQNLGFSLGFGCSLANPGSRRAARALQATREDRLLLETDSPDIPPRHLPGWPPEALNEPRYLALVAETAAALLGRPEAEVAALAAANTRRIFA
nr:TatD family hydrolase [uncultured Holophaga sp.]